MTTLPTMGIVAVSAFVQTAAPASERIELRRIYFDQRPLTLIEADQKIARTARYAEVYDAAVPSNPEWGVLYRYTFLDGSVKYEVPEGNFHDLVLSDTPLIPDPDAWTKALAQCRRERAELEAANLHFDI